MYGYQYPNPVNDFYMRNAQQQYGYQFPPQSQQPQVSSRFVTSVDEAKAAIINPLTYNLFLDSGTGKIYLKKLGNDGRSEFITYSPEESKPTESNQQTQNPNADALNEINARLTNIEKSIGEIRNDKSVPDDSGNAEPSVYAPAAATGQNGADEAAEPAGFPKNAGINKWKKR